LLAACPAVSRTLPSKGLEALSYLAACHERCATIDKPDHAEPSVEITLALSRSYLLESQSAEVLERVLSCPAPFMEAVLGEDGEAVLEPLLKAAGSTVRRTLLSEAEQLQKSGELLSRVVASVTLPSVYSTLLCYHQDCSEVDRGRQAIQQQGRLGSHPSLYTDIYI
jgi:hypothetical protein